jgi:hypothetical protein
MTNNNMMNWPLDTSWSCEICDNTPFGIDGMRLLMSSGLHWGIVHATCYCNKCKTPYRMRDKNNEVVTFPICQVKSDWMAVTKALWKTHGIKYLELEIQEWEDEFEKQGLSIPKETT